MNKLSGLSDSEIKVGDKFKMVWPFNKYDLVKFRQNIGDSFFWQSGCKVEDEPCDNGLFDRSYIAHGEGIVCYEVLSVAEMPSKMLSRVIFKRTLIDPDGKRYGKPDVRMLTETIFRKDIAKASPFKAEYEVL